MYLANWKQFDTQAHRQDVLLRVATAVVVLVDASCRCHSTRFMVTKDYLFTCLTIQHNKLFPLLFYYDTMTLWVSSYPLSIDLSAKTELRRRWKIRRERLESFPLLRPKVPFNYLREELVFFALRPLRDTNGCWIIGTINCVRFVTSYKLRSPANASLIIFTQWISFVLKDSSFSPLV